MALILSVMDKCNQNCLFCSAAGRKDRLDIDFLYAEIEKEDSHITLSGGEPALSPYIFKIINKIKSRGAVCELQSNGAIFSRPGIAEKFVKAGVDLFNINYPSHIARTADMITRTPGFHLLREKGINNLIGAGGSVRLTHVICRPNFQESAMMTEYIAHNIPDTEYIQYSFVKTMGAAREDNLVPDYGEVAPFLEKAFHKCREYGIEFMFDHIPVCFFPAFREHHVDHRKFLYGGDMRFAEREKVKMDECRLCLENDRCAGVRKDYIEIKGKPEIFPIISD